MSSRSLNPGASQSGDDPQLRAYREWALQSATMSLFDTGTAWAGSPPALGLHEIEEDERTVRGQAELRRVLEPAVDFAMRIRSLVLLGAGGLIALTWVQLVPLGIELTVAQFFAGGSVILITTIAIAVVMRRLEPRAFFIAEQMSMVVAWTVVAGLTAFSDGAESPFLVWWLFPTCYCAYFMPPRVAMVNLVAIVVLALAPVVYDASGRDAVSLLTLILSANVFWVVGWITIAGRKRARRAERTLRLLALADTLTGVANLRSFEPMVERLSANHNGRFTLILVQMRGLKGANATFGYEAGDDMLRRLAVLLTYACGEDDQVARLHGDEFAVLLPDAGEAEAVAWRDRLARALDEHNTWARGRLPRISVEIGDAEFPRDGELPEALFDLAERRLSEAKARSVKQPYEVDRSLAASTAEMLRPESSEVRESTEDVLRGRATHDALRWLFATVLCGVWAVLPGSDVSNRTALMSIAVACAALSVTSIAVRDRPAAAVVIQISDIARITAIVPVIWLTGGWESPLLIATIFPVIYYAQFTTGRTAMIRIAAAMAVFTFAFWAAESAGASPGPPDNMAQTRFVTILGAQFLIAVMLQSNRRTADRTLRRIAHAAVFDPVTGARNVRGFRQELSTAVAAVEQRPASPSATPAGVAGHEPVPALAIVDIDDFRAVNNLGGHIAGDAVLRETAARMRASVGESGTVYRIDSDEFALLTKCESPEQMDELVADLRSRLGSIPAGVGYGASASVGAAVWHRGEDTEGLVEEARAALTGARGAASDRRAKSDGETLL